MTNSPIAENRDYDGRPSVAALDPGDDDPLLKKLIEIHRKPRLEETNDEIPPTTTISQRR